MVRRDHHASVILFGDSVTFGLGVSDHETFAAILAKDARRYHVTNLATQGYGPGQSLLKMEHLLPGLPADQVIFGLCLGNDLADVVSRHHLCDEAIPKPRFVLRGQALHLEEARSRDGWKRRLLDHSFLLARLAPSVQGRVQPSPEVARRLTALRALSPEAEDTVVAIVRRMRELAESRGSRFLLVVFPDARSSERSSPRWPRLKGKLEGAADVLDLVPVLAGEGAYTPNTLDHIGHLSVKGHRVAAERIAARLAVTH